MKIQIRKGVFETNSSSTHALSIKRGSANHNKHNRKVEVDLHDVENLSLQWRTFGESFQYYKDETKKDIENILLKYNIFLKYDNDTLNDVKFDPYDYFDISDIIKVDESLLIDFLYGESMHERISWDSDENDGLIKKYVNLAGYEFVVSSD